MGGCLIWCKHWRQEYQRHLVWLYQNWLRYVNSVPLSDLCVNGVSETSFLVVDVWDLTTCQRQSWVVEKGLGVLSVSLKRVKNSSHIIWMGSDGFRRRLVVISCYMVELTTERMMKNWQLEFLSLRKSSILQDFIISSSFALWLLQVLSGAHWTQLTGICILHSSWQTSKASPSADGSLDLLLEGLELEQAQQ